MSRIVLTTLGSLGDLHPSIAIALGLKARGHQPVLATSACYRAKIEALGLEFRPVRPDSDWTFDPAQMRWLMGQRMGTIRVVRDKLFPVLRETYDDTLAASRGADLLVSHIPWGTRLVAEATSIPWVSTMITPLGFFSVHDLPIFPVTPGLSKVLRCLGPGFWNTVFYWGKRATRGLARPWYRLRAEIGLPPTYEGNPLSDSNSPLRVLALFSKLLAPPQPDWPAATVQTGFPLYDQDGAAELPIELSRFLDDGPPPIVFTLGISSAIVGGRFFDESIEAARRLDRRAVLVVGRKWPGVLPSLPREIMPCEYAPFSKLFPRAAAIVHAGGIGTTGLSMHAGRPALVVPFAHDQPDNAERLTRTGMARTLYPRRYTARRAASELSHLLDDPSYAARAAGIAQAIRSEDGVSAACDAIEGVLK